MNSRPEDAREEIARGTPKLGPRHYFMRKPGAHRTDSVDAAEVSNILTKLAVVLLSTINAVLWEIYTEAPVMATIWAIIAIAFLVWIVREARQR